MVGHIENAFWFIKILLTDLACKNEDKLTDFVKGSVEFV